MSPARRTLPLMLPALALLAQFIFASAGPGARETRCSVATTGTFPACCSKVAKRACCGHCKPASGKLLISHSGDSPCGCQLGQAPASTTLLAGVRPLISPPAVLPRASQPLAPTNLITSAAPTVASDSGGPPRLRI